VAHRLFGVSPPPPCRGRQFCRAGASPVRVIGLTPPLILKVNLLNSPTIMKRILPIALCITTLLFTACTSQRAEPESTTASEPDMRSRVSWQLTEGWAEGEIGAEQVTFQVGDNTEAKAMIRLRDRAKESDLSVVEQWLKQSGVAELSPGDIANLFYSGAAQVTRQDLRGQMFDSRSFSSDERKDTPAVMAFMIELAEESLDIVLEGPAGVLAKEGAAFVELCESITLLQKSLLNPAQ